MQRLSGIILVLVSAVAFGAMPIFARLAYAGGADPNTLLFLRFTAAAVLLLGWMAIRAQRLPRGATLLGLVGMGAIGYVAQSLCYFNALTMVDAGLVALLLYLYPVLVAALSAMFLSEHLTRQKLAALGLALAGTVLTIGPGGGGRPLGMALAVAAAVIYSVYILAGSRLMRRVAAIPATAVITAAAALVYGALVAVRGPRLPVTMGGWAAILAVAFICTVIALATFLAGIERVGPTSAATLSTIEPAVTVGLAALVLGEAASPVRIAGGALILGAVLLLAMSDASGPAASR